MDNIDILKESIFEYAESIFGICIGYMKKHNINYDLGDDDNLSLLLKNVDNIQDKIYDATSIDELYEYKELLIRLNKQVRGIVDEGIKS